MNEKEFTELLLAITYKKEKLKERIELCKRMHYPSAQAYAENRLKDLNNAERCLFEKKEFLMR